jgi:ferredoxin-like protein FixX
MFSNLFQKKYQFIGFEDVLHSLKNKDKFIIINTLNHNEQNVLIHNTLPSTEEESIINSIIQKKNISAITIIIYGKNYNDTSVEAKYDKLIECGFKDIAIYKGGLFEWLLLQDIYGKNNFPTSGKEIDILKFKPLKTFGNHLITY